MFDAKVVLDEEDYFLGDIYTTILNSEFATITRWDQLISELKPNELYFDTEFGPRDNEDIEGCRKALFSTEEKSHINIDPEFVTWLTPDEILGSNRCSFTNNEASSNEVKQGYLGNCWFIGALSLLATRSELFKGGLSKYKLTKDFNVTPHIAKEMTQGVYPPIFRWYEKYGLYVFKFYKNFNWRYVIIDNRIPWDKIKKTPIFGRCNDLEIQWVSLIEKAYAKLHMWYEALIGGFVDDGLADFTGFVAEKITLHDNNGAFSNKKLGDKNTFWNYLMDRKNERSMLGWARRLKETGENYDTRNWLSNKNNKNDYSLEVTMLYSIMAFSSIYITIVPIHFYSYDSTNFLK